MPAVSAGLMAILIGTDEAGYGPNLGPLVVSATMWHVPDEFARADLYQTLSDFVVRPFDKSPNDARVVIGDSKQLYSPANGLAQLECGVLAALGVLKLRTKTWREVWQALDSAADSD